jgi:ATP/maltotriose-dependent transcriptional regulator MalT
MEKKIDQEVRLQKRMVALRRHYEHKTKLFSRRSAPRNQVDTKALLAWREREVLVGIASGASDEEIAKKLNISLKEIKADINNIYKKLNAPNRLQAVLWAAAHL